MFSRRQALVPLALALALPLAASAAPKKLLELETQRLEKVAARKGFSDPRKAALQEVLIEHDQARAPHLVELAKSLKELEADPKKAEALERFDSAKEALAQLRSERFDSFGDKFSTPEKLRWLRQHLPRMAKLGASLEMDPATPKPDAGFRERLGKWMRRSVPGFLTKVVGLDPKTVEAGKLAFQGFQKARKKELKAEFESLVQAVKALPEEAPEEEQAKVVARAKDLKAKHRALAQEHLSKFQAELGPEARAQAITKTYQAAKKLLYLVSFFVEIEEAKLFL